MTDEELIAGMARGDERAVKYLYRHLLPPIFTWLCTKVPPQEAEDITQAAVLSELRRRPTIPLRLDKATYATYLRRICYHLLLKYFRDKKRTGSVTPELLAVLSEEAAIEKELESIDLQQRLDDAFAALDPNCRKLLKQYLILGKSLRSLAEEWDVNYATLRQRAVRCAKKLRGLLGDDPRNSDNP